LWHFCAIEHLIQEQKPQRWDEVFWRAAISLRSTRSKAGEVVAQKQKFFSLVGEVARLMLIIAQ
jgi:hypothetical protein